MNTETLNTALYFSNRDKLLVSTSPSPRQSTIITAVASASVSPLESRPPLSTALAARFSRIVLILASLASSLDTSTSFVTKCLSPAPTTSSPDTGPPGIQITLILVLGLW
uniref:Uncharacterized protein n=1 Tax=Knipowitschia caucasica TaxID=637954 RepID=A0AAV2L2M2_KNICA